MKVYVIYVVGYDSKNDEGIDFPIAVVSSKEKAEELANRYIQLHGKASDYKHFDENNYMEFNSASEYIENSTLYFVETEIDQFIPEYGIEDEWLPVKLPIFKDL